MSSDRADQVFGDDRGRRHGEPGPDEVGPEAAPAPDPSVPGPESDVVRPVAEDLGLTPRSEVGRAALNRAKAAALARGAVPGRPVRRSSVAGERGRRQGERPGDGRDPVLLGDTLSHLAAERGWRAELSVGSVIGRWREVVGDQIAEHCIPEAFEDGRLVLRTDSSTWATQVRLLVPQLMARLEQDLGPDVVREITVLGPSGPSWRRGPRRVPGRGPRDTYG